MTAAPPLFHLTRGQSRLIISVPHAGTFIPDDVAHQLNAEGRALVDTDWHVDRLYDFAPSLGATLLTATHSRTLVDLNRAPEGGPLYPGQAETTVVPTDTFDGASLYDGPPPGPAERARRVALYWQPYHAALQAELDRIHTRHGHAILLDGHSIRPNVPRLFPGTLPDLNYGINSGAACTPGLARRALAATAPHGFSQVLDGRFRGGHITRQYGRPERGVEAIQLEMATSTYMDAPGPYDPPRAARLVASLHALVRELIGAVQT